MAYKDRLVALEATKFNFNGSIGRTVVNSVRGTRKLYSIVKARERLEDYEFNRATLKELFDVFSLASKGGSERSKGIVARRIFEACVDKHVITDPPQSVFLQVCFLEVLATYGSMRVKKAKEHIEPLQPYLGLVDRLWARLTNDVRLGKYLTYDERTRYYELKRSGLDRREEYAKRYCKPLLEKRDPNGINIFEKKPMVA